MQCDSLRMEYKLQENNLAYTPFLYLIEAAIVSKNINVIFKCTTGYQIAIIFFVVSALPLFLSYNPTNLNLTLY
jgi:hypothetical protein